MTLRTRCATLLALLVASAAAHADAVDAVNAVRKRGCKGHAGVAARLRHTARLDAVAREWSRGGVLKEALARTDYRATASASVRVLTAKTDADVESILERYHCETITDRDFTEVGTYRRNREIWLVVAAPVVMPTAADVAQAASRVLELVNQARQKDRRCGGVLYRATTRLTRSALLERAALAHARDMAAHSLFEHEGSNGSSPMDRITAAGYQWRHAAENIAAGVPDAEGVVAGWLASPGHCANIMNPTYTEMGVAFAVNAKSTSRIYWSQEFATPVANARAAGR